MPVMSRLVAPTLLTTAAFATESPVVRLDMYRAMGGTDVSQFTDENDDLADISGVLKYIHTECIAEHLQGEVHGHDRTTRKYGIDVIAQIPMKVKNNPLFLQQGGNNVDFGIFQAYDVGQSTDKALDDAFAKFGDYVGVEPMNVTGYAYNEPYYWVSISGYCPNLPWVCLAGASEEECYGGEPKETSTLRCQKNVNECGAKGPKDNPNPKCLTYHKQKGHYVKGGLCNGNADALVDPTGTAGCVYSYDKNQIKTVNLDTLVGLSEYHCHDENGGRDCKDWKDFRLNCVDSSVKKRYTAGGSLETVSFCTEYDIHPACAVDCTSAACQAVMKAGDYEVGISFWRGRCDVSANRIRAAKLADAVGIEGALTAHELVAKEVQEAFATCKNSPGAGSSACGTPDYLKGESFCTRAWSGICSRCYIPGAANASNDGINPLLGLNPTCPVDILLHNSDYKNQGKVKCANSSSPREWCCIYNGDCTEAFDEAIDDPANKAPLDDDGWALVRAFAMRKKDSQAIVDFLARFNSEQNSGFKYVDDSKKAALLELVYWQWSTAPGPIDFIKTNSTWGNPSFKQVWSVVEKGNYFTDVMPTPAPTPAPAAGGGGGSPVLVIVIVVLVLLVVGGGAAFFVSRKRAAARDVRLLDNSQMAVQPASGV